MATEDIAKIDTSEVAKAADGIKTAVKTAEMNPADDADFPGHTSGKSGRPYIPRSRG
jgi:hypothetical protein